ncbi:MAG: RNA polymerase sigma factor [Bacteroidota bacterium]
MQSFKDIVDTYSGQVYNHALSLLKSKEDAEEATQDVFLKISKAIELFRGDAKLSTWIWRITANVCYTRLAKKKLPSVALEDGALNVEDPHSFITEINRAESRKVIEDALSLLPQQQASILLLFYFEGMNYKEIAAVFNIPEGTIATQLHRGKVSLRRHLGRTERESL